MARNPWGADLRRAHHASRIFAASRVLDLRSARVYRPSRHARPGPQRSQDHRRFRSGSVRGWILLRACRRTVELEVAAKRLRSCSCWARRRKSRQAQALISRYRSADLDARLPQVIAHWDEVLGTVQVKTPDRAMDLMLNRWLLYQTLACRIWARSGFYQASGAYGFRDQLQDRMALALSRPALTREHICCALPVGSFLEGDVQHWWLPAHRAGRAHAHLRRSRLARLYALPITFPSPATARAR